MMSQAIPVNIHITDTIYILFYSSIMKIVVFYKDTPDQNSIWTSGSDAPLRT